MPYDTWKDKNVLIVVKTYPTPALKGIEVSCTAGITEDGEWIRLFPVPFRLMDGSKRFRKYQWVRLRIKKASDPRPESYNIDPDSIKILSEPLGTNKAWSSRRRAVEHLQGHCMCCIQEKHLIQGSPTLALFRPHRIISFKIESDSSSWTEQQLARLRQTSFLDHGPSEELEKIPFKFKYHYSCDHSACNTHTMICTDWEMNQAFREWKRTYGVEWESKFRQKFEHEMIQKNDTHFFAGTVNNHPKSWIIVGLFYPPIETQPPLF